MKIHYRQACGIESAAKWNLNRDIFILHVAKVGFLSNDKIIRALLSYPNIQFRNVDLYNYTAGTLAEKWIKDDQILSTNYFDTHLTDLLRFVTLFRFGGVHLNMDFIIQKHFDDLPMNFAVIDDKKNLITNRILGINSNFIGHSFARQFLRFVHFIILNIYNVI